MSAPSKDSSDAESAIEHLKRVATLADQLKSLGFAIYEHHWDCLCFGSWTITAGRRKDCYEFGWDGREFFMSVAHSEDVSSGRPQTWRPIDNQRLSPDDQKDPLEFIHAFFTKKKSG